VTTVRQARTACAQRIELTQAGRPILGAAVWSVGAVDGLTHHVAIPPDVPGPLDAPTIHEPAPFPFWDNVESRPLDFIEPWPPSEPFPPVWRAWLRLRPRATFEDLWIDAARSVILIDVQGWPAAARYHAWRQPPFIAPSLDLSVAFHEPATDTPWLLADGFAPTAGAGLIGWTGRLWTDAGRLVASGGGQLLCRRLPPPA
jgi:acyl-CoA thioesterase-2